jgi:hypothetical protein
MNIIRELILKQLSQARATIEIDNDSKTIAYVDKIKNNIKVSVNFYKCSYVAQDFLIIYILLRENIESIYVAWDESICMLLQIYTEHTHESLEEYIDLYPRIIKDEI